MTLSLFSQIRVTPLIQVENFVEKKSGAIISCEKSCDITSCEVDKSGGIVAFTFLAPLRRILHTLLRLIVSLFKDFVSCHNRLLKVGRLAAIIYQYFVCFISPYMLAGASWPL